MTVEVGLLAVTTLLALVAVSVAAVSVRTARQLSAQVRELQAAHDDAEATARMAVPALSEPVESPQPVRPIELAPRVVEGRVIVPPTQMQVVHTALGRPGVRLSVLLHGLARALQAENRDRIVALMRREYRHRRRERLRAGRQAMRMARPSSAPTTARAERMVSS